MTINQILNYAYPYTAKQRKCNIEREKWKYKRKKLQDMIEAYKRGDVVNFEPLRISIDLKSVLGKLNN